MRVGRNPETFFTVVPLTPSAGPRNLNLRTRHLSSPKQSLSPWTLNPRLQSANRLHKTLNAVTETLDRLASQSPQTWSTSPHALSMSR
jgi:hypothetical protein